jgi:nucleotide-binding universal stress UspA family protein
MPAPIIAAYEPYSEDRAPVALALAASELTGAPVIAAAVHPWTVSEGWSDPSLSADAQEAMTASLQRLHDDLGVETRVLSDVSVPRGLHNLARELEAGLIVVGSTTRGPAGRAVTGSTAERLLHGAPCPIALAPQGYTRTRLETIAVGFVDSVEGRGALEAAHALAARAGARLRVIAAVHPSGGLDAAMADGLRPPRGYMLQGRHRSEVEAAMERAIAALPAGVEVESELHVEDPADILLRVSEHVDLLVCGSRGYGPLRSVLLGGVSRRLVNGSQCPVLVLPREARVPLEDLMSPTGAVAAQ